MGWSNARDAGKSAHFMRVSEALVCNRAIRGLFRVFSPRIVVGTGEFAILGCAAAVPALELLALALALHRVFADKAARAVEAGMAPWRAERVVFVVRRRRQFRAAPW